MVKSGGRWGREIRRVDSFHFVIDVADLYEFPPTVFLLI
jgi:hypothetical protein